jgi:hypothetical protein
MGEKKAVIVDVEQTVTVVPAVKPNGMAMVWGTGSTILQFNQGGEGFRIVGCGRCKPLHTSTGNF